LIACSWQRSSAYWNGWKKRSAGPKVSSSMVCLISGKEMWITCMSRRSITAHSRLNIITISISGSAAQCRLWPPHITRFLDHTRRATVGRTPLDKWSAHRRDLYLTTHNRETSMLPVGLEPKIAAGERL
jgi:hypothetical protein